MFTENIYNNAPYPIFIDDIYTNIGLTNQAFSLNQGVFTCTFRRSIKNDLYADKFFNLNNEYYVFLAKGPLNSFGITVFKLKHK